MATSSISHRPNEAGRNRGDNAAAGNQSANEAVQGQGANMPAGSHGDHEAVQGHDANVASRGNGVDEAMQDARFFLRLRDLATDAESLVVPLRRGVSSQALNVAHEGVVHESHEYQAALLCSVQLPDGEFRWSVNDEDDVEMALHCVPGHQQRVGDEPLFFHQLLVVGGRSFRPFAMTYGFARVCLHFDDSYGNMLLSTNDLVCLCDRSNQETVVADVLDVLMNGADPQVMDWILNPAKLRAEKHSLVETSSVADASASLPSFVALCNRIVSFYESKLSYFCAHAYRRTTKASVKVAPSQARRLGRSELLWLSRHPEVLGKTDRPTPIQVGGQGYLPSKVETESPHTTRDVMENRALLSFLGEVVSSVTRVLDDARAELDEIRQMETSLQELATDEEEGLLLPLFVLRTCLEREFPLIEKAAGLRQRAKRVLDTLSHSLPEVARGRYRLPRRTKPFQEIPAYLELHSLMRDWDAFGRFQMVRDGLLLQTWRMDKLYEYYVLHELLKGLRLRGFTPSVEEGEPCDQVAYSLADDDFYFRNETQVANRFRLRRGVVRAQLFYQPVFYGGLREEHGVCVHRTTVSNPYIESYWTPDYLLLLEGPAGSRAIVVDAKFRPVAGVKFAGAESGRESTFQECLRKYKLESCCSDGSAVDALWLLCGREARRQSELLQCSVWARTQTERSGADDDVKGQRPQFVPDGIACVAPAANAVDDFFAAVLDDWLA